MELSETVDKVMEEVSQVVDVRMAELIRNFLLQCGDDLIAIGMDSLPTEEECRKMIDEVTAQASESLTEEQVITLRSILEDLYLRGKSFAEALQLTKQNLEDIYTMGYTSYNAGQYQEAKNIFNFLTLMNREEPRYFFGAAAAYHMLKDYPNAIAFYTYCTMLDLLNPLPWYHLGDCYMHEGQKHEAAVAFDYVLARTKGNPIYSKIETRAQMIRDKIIAEEAEK